MRAELQLHVYVMYVYTACIRFVRTFSFQLGNLPAGFEVRSFAHVHMGAVMTVIFFLFQLDTLRAGSVVTLTTSTCQKPAMAMYRREGFKCVGAPRSHLWPTEYIHGVRIREFRRVMA